MLKQFRPFHALVRDFTHWKALFHPLTNRGLTNMLKQFGPFHALDKDFIHWIALSTL